MLAIPRPAPESLSPGVAQYVAQVPEGDLLAFLETQTDQFDHVISALDEARGGHRYAPGKWSLKEVLGHINDTERICAYRLLCIARGEAQSLPGFEQDDYVASGHFDQRSLGDLLAEFLDIRRASLSLLKSLDEAALHRSGTANGRPYTVAGLAYLLAGHAQHHFSVLTSRYLP